MTDQFVSTVNGNLGLFRHAGMNWWNHLLHFAGKGDGYRGLAVVLGLYREIRVENTLNDEHGKKVSLKPGAEVQVTIEADADATKPKNAPDEEAKK